MVKSRYLSRVGLLSDFADIWYDMVHYGFRD